MELTAKSDEQKRLSELENMKASLELQLKEMARQVKRQQEEIELAKIDSLTGLRRREGIDEEINEILRKNREGIFIIIDMDNFKNVNDTYGHIEGDKVLKRFAGLLKKNTLPDDLLIRIGGDEFVIFRPHVISRENLRKEISRLLRTITKGLVEPGRLVRITLSAGVSIAPNDGITFERLYMNADEALYGVKKSGKGNFKFYDEYHQLKRKSNKKRATLQEITTALKEKNMEGSYVVEYDNFEKIYRFLERNLEREHRDIQCVLFTIEEPMDMDYDEIEMQRQMEHLQHAVVKALRRGDVTTNYSENQILVLLLDVNAKDAHQVINRIIKHHDKEMNGNSWIVTNEIQQLVAGERA